MTQKKLFQIIGIVIAAVWIFCITLVITVKVVKPDTTTTMPTTNPPATTAPNVITTTPTTTLPTTTQGPLPTQNVVGGNNLATTVTVGDPQWMQPTAPNIVPQGKEKIIEAYLTAINGLKNNPNFTMTNKGKLSIDFDSITGGALAEEFAKGMLEDNQPEDITYHFLNGIDNTTGQTPMTAIAPLGVYAKVDSNAVKSATASANNDGGFTIILTIQGETQSRNGTTETPAPNLSTMVEVIDVNDLLSQANATINSLTINYGDTVIKATFNSASQLVSMDHYLNVTDAVGSGQLKLAIVPINVNMKLHGNFESNYTFSYN